VGKENFEWIVDVVAELAVKKIRAAKPKVPEFHWSAYLGAASRADAKAEPKPAVAPEQVAKKAAIAARPVAKKSAAPEKAAAKKARKARVDQPEATVSAIE
jgi:hypothetical protein